MHPNLGRKYSTDSAQFLAAAATMSAKNSKLMHHNSFDTVTMSSGRRSSRANDTSFSCSQQSILSAMDRFVKSVSNMDSTVLVPIKLRDMEISRDDGQPSAGGKPCAGGVGGKRRPSQCKPPTILRDGDLYAFYLMLHDVKKELLWGPSSALSTIATSAGTAAHHGSHGALSSLAQSSNGSTNGYGGGGGSSSPTVSGCFARPLAPAPIASSLRHAAGSSGSLVSMDAASTSIAAPSTASVSAAATAPGPARNRLRRENTHSRQPSDDSLGSLGSAASTLDLDSESEADSVLADRDPAGSGESEPADHTLHLAAAFKQHLQGLHTILHQLADTADYFCQRYQEEVDSLAEDQ